MTDERNASDVAAIAGPRPAVVGRPRSFVLWGPAVAFAVIATFIGGDIASDLASGASALHISIELGVMGVAVTGLAVMWTHLRAAEARARDLQRDLDGTRADLVRWRAEAQEVLRGLGAAIDLQFARWELTPAEREVALLLLKGLSLKEVADLRATSERTVRQQALTVYRKAGLAGRAELAAFFLEDLLLPTERGAAGPSRERATR